MLICAEDGWVDEWVGGAPERWNFKGCSKYQKFTIYCLNAENELKTAKPSAPQLSRFGTLIWRITNMTKQVTVEFTNSDLSPLETFKTSLVRAVKADDDVLTQFKSKKSLVEAISRAQSYAELRELYHQNGWV